MMQRALRVYRSEMARDVGKDFDAVEDADI